MLKAMTASIFLRPPVWLAVMLVAWPMTFAVAPAEAGSRAEARQSRLTAPERTERRERWRKPRFTGFASVAYRSPRAVVVRERLDVRVTIDPVPTVLGIRPPPAGEPVIYRIERSRAAAARGRQPGVRVVGLGD